MEFKNVTTSKGLEADAISVNPGVDTFILLLF